MFLKSEMWAKMQIIEIYVETFSIKIENFCTKIQLWKCQGSQNLCLSIKLNVKKLGKNFKEIFAVMVWLVKRVKIHIKQSASKCQLEKDTRKMGWKRLCFWGKKGLNYFHKNIQNQY